MSINNTSAFPVLPATLIVGAGEPLYNYLAQLAATLGHPVFPNPDCLVLSPQTDWGIKAVRSIDLFFSQKSYNHPTRLAILNDVETLEIPAQNALLKTIENPGPNCFIILTTSYPNRLITTIRSRCHSLFCPPDHVQHSVPELKSLSDVDDFLATSPDIRTYFNSLLATTQRQLLSSPSPHLAQTLSTIIRCLSMIDHRVDPKLTLDYFVLKTFPA